MGDKKDKKGQKSTTEILKENRSVLYGDEVEVSSVLNNVLTLLNRMDTRLSTIEKNTGKNTVTLNQMNDKLNTLTARVITAETDIVHVKSRVADVCSRSFHQLAHPAL
jgi:DNA repair ATPase RecN